MAKSPELVDVTAGFASASAQNANNDKIEASFNNTLSRDGSSPNAMEADLDMNSNDVLNVGQLGAATFVLNGTTITPSSTVGTAATTSEDGLMSKEDKQKLDNLAAISFSTRQAAIDASTTAERLYIRGYTTEGDGGEGWWNYSSTEPFHALKFQSGGRWYEKAPENGWINDKQAGVVGDGTTDDTTALQNAINFCVHYSAAGEAAQCNLRLISEKIRTTDTIHILYGDGSGSIYIQGFAKPFRSEDAFNGSAIISEVTDRMAVSICGARHVVLENVYVKGLAGDDILNLDRNAASYDSESTWDTALTTAGYTNPGERYAPRAGFMVDGYCGTKPGGASGSGTEPYPTPTLPSYISAGTDGYGRTTSSRVDFINCTAQGFELGFGVGSSVDGLQGDYVSFERCLAERNKICLSVGQSQSRGVQLDRFQPTRFFTAITNNTHGAQVGRFATEINLDGGSGVNVFSIVSSSTVGPISFHGEMEAIRRIGDLGTGTSADHGITFRDCKFNFNHETALSFPANVLDCNNSTTRVKFKNCIFNGFGYAFSFHDSPNVYLEDDCRTLPEIPRNAPEAIFHNGLAGFVGDVDAKTYRHHEIMAQPYTIATTPVAGTVQTFGPNYTQVTRDYCIPLWSREFGQSPASTGTLSTIHLRPHYSSTISNSTIFNSGTFNAGTRSISATIASPNQTTDMHRGGQPGDLFKCVNTGSALRVDSYNYGTGAVSYKLLTNCYISNANKNRRGDWTVSTTYAIDDVVRSTTDYEYYICTVAGTSSGDDSDLAGSSDTGVTWVAVTWAIIDSNFDITTSSCDRVSLSVYTTSSPLYITSTSSSKTLSSPQSTTTTSATTIMNELSTGDAIKARDVRYSPSTTEASTVIDTISAGTNIVMIGNATNSWSAAELTFFHRKYT